MCEEGTLNRKKSTPKLKQPETHHSLLPFLSLSPPLILFLLYINLFFLWTIQCWWFSVFFFTYLFPSSSFLLMIKYYLFVYFVDVNFFFCLETCKVSHAHETLSSRESFVDAFLCVQILLHKCCVQIECCPCSISACDELQAQVYFEGNIWYIVLFILIGQKRSHSSNYK